MKNWIKITAIVLAFFVSPIILAQSPGFHDVKVAEFEKLAKAGNGTTLDVRTPKEYVEGHLKGSINMNYFDKDFKIQVGKLDKAKPVYVYCHSGGRSSKLCFAPHLWTIALLARWRSKRFPSPSSSMTPTLSRRA